MQLMTIRINFPMPVVDKYNWNCQRYLNPNDNNNSNDLHIIICNNNLLYIIVFFFSIYSLHHILFHYSLKENMESFWPKKLSHWRTKIRPGIQNNWRILESNWLDIESQIVNLTINIESKWLYFFFQCFLCH